MDVTDLLRRLLRRWISVVVVVVLALAAAAFGWTRASSMHQTVAAVVIVPPRLGSEVSQQNPLLNLDNNLAQLATVLAQAMGSSNVGDALQRAGATASFSISTVTGTNPSFSQLSPQLEFTVTGDTTVRTVFTATTLVSLANSQLTALQNRANVSPGARATLVESVVPTGAQVVSGSRVRSAGSLGLAVVVVGLLAVLVMDAILGRRRPTVTDDDAVADDNEVGDEPVENEPVEDGPVENEPVEDEPVENELVGDELVGDEPVGDEPVSDEPGEDEPRVDLIKANGNGVAAPADDSGTPARIGR